MALASGPKNLLAETKVCVIVDSRTPIIIKVPVTPSHITLNDLKSALPGINKPSYKYYFKSNDSEFGIVKEEIRDDDAILPTYKNRVVAWIVTPDQVNSEFNSSKDGTFKTLSEFASETCNSTYGPTSRPFTTTTLTTYDDGMSSILTTDLETTSYFTETEDDSISCSNYSRTTCETFIPRRREGRNKLLPNDRASDSADRNCLYESMSKPYHNINNNGQYKNGTNNLNDVSSSSSTTSSSSNPSSTNSSDSYSDATAVQCITVNLVLNNENFLGLHIYANAVNGVDEGIYVDGVTENSAVAQDGRIEPGDRLIQVNDINLEELNNDEAVKVLKDAVIKRGPIKLVVAKFIETNHHKSDPIAGLKETVQPIDTAAWVAHAQAITIPNHTSQNQLINQYDHRANSTNSTPSFGSANAHDTDCIRPASTGMHGLGLGLAFRLNKNINDIKDIVQHMQIPKFGVELRDREWLKILIPRAFLGADLVAWLERNVYGFSNVRDAKKFASRLLREGYIKDPISKKSFSSKSYYTFETNVS